jgi:hypothetical protein
MVGECSEKVSVVHVVIGNDLLVGAPFVKKLLRNHAFSQTATIEIDRPD